MLGEGSVGQFVVVGEHPELLTGGSLTETNLVPA